MSVRTAHDADEALRMAPVLRPDLVVLRDDLLGMSTRNFCADMRALVPHVKLLLVTELLGQLDETFACDGCLVQPVDARQLLETCASMLELRIRRSPRAPLEALVQLSGFDLITAGASCVANAIDVSEHGILLESSEQLVLGSLGKVLFFLPEEGGRVAVAGTARVAMDEVRLHYAIEFQGVDEETRGLLARYVRDQKRD
jgi:DNA-binding response OmpR family regulator